MSVAITIMEASRYANQNLVDFLMPKVATVRTCTQNDITPVVVTVHFGHMLYTHRDCTKPCPQEPILGTFIRV